MAEEKKNSIEENMKALEEIIGKLEGSELTLEESLQEFEKGTALVRECNVSLTEAEKKLQVLTKDGGLNEF